MTILQIYDSYDDVLLSLRVLKEKTGDFENHTVVGTNDKEVYVVTINETVALLLKEVYKHKEMTKLDLIDPKKSIINNSRWVGCKDLINQIIIS